MKSLHISEERGRFYLELHDSPGVIRLAEFGSAMAMSMFVELARKPGIVLTEKPLTVTPS